MPTLVLSQVVKGYFFSAVRFNIFNIAFNSNNKFTIDSIDLLQFFTPFMYNAFGASKYGFGINGCAL